MTEQQTCGALVRDPDRDLSIKLDGLLAYKNCGQPIRGSGPCTYMWAEGIGAPCDAGAEDEYHRPDPSDSDRVWHPYQPSIWEHWCGSEHVSEAAAAKCIVPDLGHRAQPIQEGASDGVVA